MVTTGLCASSTARRSTASIFHECLAYGVESDARFEQLDQRLRYICRDHPEDFVPREERYPNVKVPGMGKKFKAEPIGG